MGAYLPPPPYEVIVLQHGPPFLIICLCLVADCLVSSMQSYRHIRRGGMKYWKSKYWV